MVPMSMPERWLAPRFRPPYHPASCAAATDVPSAKAAATTTLAFMTLPFDVGKAPLKCSQAAQLFALLGREEGGDPAHRLRAHQRHVGQRLARGLCEAASLRIVEAR